MTDSQRLSRVFVELADTLVTDFDVVDFMTMLADRCVELLHATEAGVVLADEHQSLRSVASSNETAHLLELFEIQNEEGPCLDCYRTGQPILNHPLAPPHERWPTFEPEAWRLGFQVVHALPMRLRGHVIGAVNVFAAEPDPLDRDELDIGQALADVATVSLLQERSIREARILNEQLHTALNTRIVIEQAKGVLGERRNVSMEEAFAALRAHARNTNRKLHDVAQGVVDGSTDASALLPNDRGTAE
jgi:transcriptional regulator with GAF, ATPase, and Fis domain